MAVNPDAANRLKVSFRQPRAGSCLTPEVLSELADLLDIQLAEGAGDDSVCISKDVNNLARRDAQNCLLVPGAVLHTEELEWQVSSGADLEFEEHAAKQIDATACFFGCYLLVDSAETGTAVKGDPAGTEHIRPNYEVKSITANKIVIAVKNAKSDVSVRIQLLQLPIPEESA